MNFVYNADTGKVVDGDIVPLETLEDLNKEIQKTVDEIKEMEFQQSNQATTTLEKILGREITKYKTVLNSLLDLKKSKFGNDAKLIDYTIQPGDYQKLKKVWNWEHIEFGGSAYGPFEDLYKNLMAIIRIEGPGHVLKLIPEEHKLITGIKSGDYFKRNFSIW